MAPAEWPTSESAHLQDGRLEVDHRLMIDAVIHAERARQCVQIPAIARRDETLAPRASR